MAKSYDVIVVGAGILGCFHAHFASLRGLRTLLMERGDSPREASVRNFGMAIASAMQPGIWHDRAVRSGEIYRQLAQQLNFPLHTGGTQYLATTPLEQAVLSEFAQAGPGAGYVCHYLDARASRESNPHIHPENILASLVAPEDLRFESRAFLPRFLEQLSQHPEIEYHPRTVVTRIESRSGQAVVCTADGMEVHAPTVFVCTGADFRTLFPQAYQNKDLVHCQLQMMQTAPIPGLCWTTNIVSGLSLRRYPAFTLCPSHGKLLAEPVDPELEANGIHVLAVADGDGRLTLGDSHHYRDPFREPDFPDVLQSRIEELIVKETHRILNVRPFEIQSRWQGVYGLRRQAELFEGVLDDGCIRIVTGIGGKGMTVGPAIAEENIALILSE